MKIKSGSAAFSAALVLFFGLAAGAFAAVPGLLSYQGTLRKSGVLFNGTVTMQFRITSADGSSVYWTSDSTDVAVAGGLFRYALGSPNEAQFAAIPWKDITPYVQMEVDGGWMPREPLYTSAYAMHAYTAETSSGTFTAYDGDIRISTSAGSKGIVFQDGSAQYSAAGWAVAGQNAVAAVTGNAGVGVAAPQARLDVQAATPAGYSQIWRNSSGVVKASMTAAGLFYGTKLEINDGDGNTTTSGIKFDNFSCTNTQKLTADVSGNLVCATDISGTGGGGGGTESLADALGYGNNANGLTISNLGTLSLGMGTAAGTILDVQGDAAGNAQFWRDHTSGAITASMTSSGTLSLAALTAGGQITASSATLTGASGIGAYQLNLNPGILLSSSAANGGVYISSSVSIAGTASASKYFGDGSALTGLSASNISAGSLADGRLSANVALLNGSQVFSGVNTFASSFTVISATGAAISRVQFSPGVSISSASVSQQGGLYISSHVYLAPGAEYYGDGSGLTAVNASNVSAGTLADGRLSANVALLNGSQVFSGVNTFPNVQLAAGVAVSSSAARGGVYVSSSVYIVGIASATQYFGDGSKLTGIISGSGNNLAATLAAGSDAGGGYIVNLSSMAVGRATAGAQLDVQASAPLTYSQIWRNSFGVAVASVNAAGVIYGDGSGLKNLLAAETDPVFAASPSYAITGTDVSNWNTAYGWGSHQTAGYSKLASNQTFTGVNTFASSATFTAQDPALPGVYVSSGLVVNLGSVGIGSSSPQAKLDVNGGIKLSNTNAAIDGTMRYSGASFDGYYGGAWHTLNGSYTIATSSALWGVTTDTVYTVGLSSKVAIGIASAGVSKLRVVGADSGPGANAFIAQDSGLTTLFTVRNDGNVGVGPVNPATRLDVQASGSDGYAQIWRNSGGSVVSAMTDAGAFSASGQITTYSSMTVDGAVGIAAHQLSLNPGVDISSSAAKGGVYVSSNVYIVGIASATKYYGDGSALTGIVGGGGGNTIDTLAATLVAGSDAGSGYIVDLASMAVGRATAGAPLDVQAAAGDSYVQIWRNSAGVAVATVTTAGVLYGDGSGLKNLLTVETDPIFAASPAYSITATSTTYWNTAYGWGSHQAAGYSKLASTQTFTGSNTFSSTAAFTAIDNSLPGVYVSSGLVVNSGDLVVNSGNVGIGSSVPQARLDVNGGVKIGDTSDTAAGLLKFTGAAFYGCNGASCDMISGSVVIDSTTFWGSGLNNTVYTMLASSNVAIGASGSVASKLLVHGAGNTSATNAFLAENSDTTQLFLVRNDGNVGVGPVNPATRLDVQASGSDGLAQIWRNVGGAMVSSMTDTGILYADGSQLRNLPKGADNLGNHVATTTLQMSGFGISNAAGIGAYQLALNPGITVSSSAAKGGVYVSSDIYIVGIASATKYYGDGSKLTGVNGSDNLGNHKATQDLNLNTFNLINVGSITASAAITTYSSMTVAGELAVNSITLNPVVGISASPTGLNLSTSVYLSAGARYYGDGSGLTGWIGTPMARNLATNGHWLSGDGDDEGLAIGSTGKVGIGVTPLLARLDVKAELGDGYVQIWRDSAGTVVSSMSDTGVIFASTTGLRGLVTGGGGFTNPATVDLDMFAHNIFNVTNLNIGMISTAAATQPYVQFSTNVLVQYNLSATGHANFGNAIAAPSTYSVVAVAEQYQTAHVNGDNIGIDAYSEVVPPSDLHNSNVAGTGGSFAASLPDDNGTNGIYMLRGVHAVGEDRNKGNVNFVVGVMGEAAKTKGGGTIDNAAGGYFSANYPIGIDATGSTITQAYGVYAKNYIGGNLGAMTTSYALFADVPLNPAGGSIINNYGLFVADQSSQGSSLSYNIYSAGSSSKNRLDGALSVGGNASVTGSAIVGGNIGINIATPNVPLEIKADSSGQLLKITNYAGTKTCTLKMQATACVGPYTVGIATGTFNNVCMTCD